MRPTNSVIGVDVYECFNCGERSEHPSAAVCGECGRQLVHLGRSRDL